jgi:hypothetical protein
MPEQFLNHGQRQIPAQQFHGARPAHRTGIAEFAGHAAGLRSLVKLASDMGRIYLEQCFICSECLFLQARMPLLGQIVGNFYHPAFLPVFAPYCHNPVSRINVACFEFQYFMKLGACMTNQQKMSVMRFLERQTFCLRESLDHARKDRSNSASCTVSKTLVSGRIEKREPVDCLFTRSSSRMEFIFQILPIQMFIFLPTRNNPRAKIKHSMPGNG